MNCLEIGVIETALKYDDNYDIKNPKGVITVDTVIVAVIPKKDKVFKMFLDIISLRKCIA